MLKTIIPQPAPIPFEPPVINVTFLLYFNGDFRICFIIDSNAVQKY